MPRSQRREAARLLVGGEPLKLRYGQARRAVTPDGTVLWIVPGRAVVCLFRAIEMVSACETAVQVARKGIFLGVYKVGEDPGAAPTEFTALGVMPEGVKALIVDVAGVRRRVEVSGNAFETSAQTPIRLVSLVREDG